MCIKRVGKNISCMESKAVFQIAEDGPPNLNWKVFYWFCFHRWRYKMVLKHINSILFNLASYGWSLGDFADNQHVLISFLWKTFAQKYDSTSDTWEECGPFMLLLNSRTLSQKEAKSSKIYTDQKDTLSYSNEIRSGMVSEPDKSLLTQNTPKQWLPGWREWLHRVIPQPTIRSTASCNRRMFSSTSHTSYKK